MNCGKMGGIRNMDKNICWMCNGFKYKPSADAILCDICLDASKDFKEWYSYEELADEGIYVHHVLSGELVRFLPNNDKVTILVREAKALWDAKDKEGFLALYRNKERFKDFTFEDRWAFKSTYFDGTSVDWIFRKIEDDFEQDVWDK